MRGDDFFVHFLMLFSVIDSVIGSMLVICGLYVLLWGKAKGEADDTTKPTLVENPNGSSAVGAADATQVSDSRCPP